MATVLSVASRAVLEACERLGLDREAIATAAGVERTVIDDPDARISTSAADAIWRHAASLAGDPLMALHAAEALPFGAYKVIDFIVANAPTVGAGLERVARYFDLIDTRGRLEVTDGDPVKLRFSSALGPLPQAAQEYTFAALVLRSRSCSGESWPLSAVSFTFAEPADTRTHRRIFDCPLRFEQQHAQLLIPRSSWERSPPGANEALFSVLDDHAHRLQAELPKSEPEVIARVRALLRRELRGGNVDIINVARELGMSERTLQRRLKQQECVFGELLSEVRREMAHGYLKQPDISLAEIAWLLGFSEQSAFTRAFKRWEGVTPGTWRKRTAPPTARAVNRPHGPRS